MPSFPELPPLPSIQNFEESPLVRNSLNFPEIPSSTILPDSNNSNNDSQHVDNLNNSVIEDKDEYSLDQKEETLNKETLKINQEENNIIDNDIDIIESENQIEELQYLKIDIKNKDFHNNFDKKILYCVVIVEIMVILFKECNDP